MITQNQYETIKFIEEEFDINNKMQLLLDQNKEHEAMLLTEDVIRELAKTLNIEVIEAGKIYDEYNDLIYKLIQNLILSTEEGIENDNH